MSKKVMLDAGHYAGVNRSPVYSKYYEGNAMWTLKNYLKEELKTYGIEVGDTRTSYTGDVKLYNRGFMAKGYDMFISLHSNASDDENVDRVVIIPGLDYNKDLAEGLGNSVKNVMGIKTHQIYTRKNSSGDEYYGVLRGAKYAGVKDRFIIEHGFHTNYKTAVWLSNDANLKKLAVEEARFIADYLGVSKPTVSDVDKKGFYRIVAGSYSSKETAQAELEKLKAKGVNAFLLYCKE